MELREMLEEAYGSWNVETHIRVLWELVGKIERLQADVYRLEEQNVGLKRRVKYLEEIFGVVRDDAVDNCVDK